MEGDTNYKTDDDHINSDNRSKIATPNTGTLYLVFIQIASRALTFAGNQFLLRYLSPNILGLAVQLELVSVTVLYTSRESLRVVLQRQPIISEESSTLTLRRKSHDEARTSSQQAVNLAYLVLLIGLCASYLFGHGYLRQSNEEVVESTDFNLSFNLYAVSTFIELLSEPAFVVVQRYGMYKSRARAETGAAVSRCVSACLTAIIMDSRQTPASVLPFAVGQLFYAGTLFLTYLASVRPVANVNSFSLLPRRISEAQTISSSDYWLGRFYIPLLTLTTTFYAQSVFKLFLTQGDSLILSLTADLKSQGAFALASNYGGLLSRLLFQPIEESSRTVFGSLLASNNDSSESSSNPGRTGKLNQAKQVTSQDVSKPVNADLSTNNNLPTHRNPPQPTTKSSPSSSSSPPSHARYQDHASDLSSETTLTRPARTNSSSNISGQAQTTKALSHLTSTLRFYTLFSLPILTLLPSILPSLIATLIGPKWSNPSTSTLLSAYSYYLPFLAVNGILDAFVTSVATPHQLRQQSLVMLLVTTIYGLVAWLLMSPPEAVSVLLLRTGLTMKSYRGIGPAGLVWANVVNMSMRIVYSIWFVNGWIVRRVANGKQEVSLLWRRSMPHAVCVGTAILVAAGMQVFVQPSTVSIGGAGMKSFFGVKGLDAGDVGYLLAGGVVLATSILTFEHQFLISMVSTAIPQRLSSKLMPYLPKQKLQ